jgi:hypothetical protein
VRCLTIRSLEAAREGVGGDGLLPPSSGLTQIGTTPSPRFRAMVRPVAEVETEVAHLSAFQLSKVQVLADLLTRREALC